MRAIKRINKKNLSHSSNVNVILNEISKELKYLKNKVRELELLETRNCILLEQNQEKMNLILQEIYKSRIVNEEQTEEILEELENKKMVIIK